MNEKKKPKFMRKDAKKILRLGKSWRRPIGRHSKVRKKRKDYPKSPSIGYGAAKKTKWLIAGAKPIRIFNASQLKDIKTGEIAIIGKIGGKKKAEIAKIALENKIKILNLNAKAFLEKLEEKTKAKKEKKKQPVKEEKKKENTETIEKKTEEAAEKTEKEKQIKK